MLAEESHNSVGMNTQVQQTTQIRLHSDGSELAVIAGLQHAVAALDSRGDWPTLACNGQSAGLPEGLACVWFLLLAIGHKQLGWILRGPQVDL